MMQICLYIHVYIQVTFTVTGVKEVLVSCVVFCIFVSCYFIKSYINCLILLQ